MVRESGIRLYDRKHNLKCSSYIYRTFYFDMPFMYRDDFMSQRQSDSPMTGNRFGGIERHKNIVQIFLWYPDSRIMDGQHDPVVERTERKRSGGFREFSTWIIMKRY